MIRRSFGSNVLGIVACNIREHRASIEISVQPKASETVGLTPIRNYMFARCLRYVKSYRDLGSATRQLRPLKGSSERTIIAAIHSLIVELCSMIDLAHVRCQRSFPWKNGKRV